MNGGTVFNGMFRIEHVLGEGGFATVYSAIDPNGVRVALKVLKADSSGGYDGATRARFEREVGLVARLQSPYTVRLFGSGQAATGELYAVFEHIPGRDLGELLDVAGRLEARWVLHILQQVLHALEEAHRKGLLHRDLKPENIRVFERGDDPMVVKLLDFGIARATDAGHPSITRTGEIIGTPKYMSPEQLLEQPLTAASDIYSLGVVMFELVLGRAVMGGSGWGAQLERLQSGYVFSLPEIDRIGPALLTVLQRMTARDPAQRFQTVAHVRNAIDRIVSAASPEVSGYDATAAPGVPSTASVEIAPKTPAPSKDTHARRIKVLAILALGLVVLGIALALLTPSPEPVAPKSEGVRSVGIVRGHEPAHVEVTETSSSLDAATTDVGSLAELRARPDLTELRPEDPRGGTRGCGRAPPFLGTGTLQQRTMYVPEGYRKNYKHPFILLLHQDGESGADLLDISGFPQLAEPDHFIVMAPASGGFAGMSAWRDDEEDMPPLRNAYELAAEQFCLDPRRVFVIGNAQGGRAAHFASCEDWVAGIGTYAYGSGNSSHHCKPPPGQPVPFVVISPTDSPHSPLHGGESCTPNELRGANDDDHDRPPKKFGVTEIQNMWVKRNRCRDPLAAVERFVHGSCYTWSDCDAIVHSCHVNGGHGWPGSSPRQFQDSFMCAGPRPTEFDVAWEFWRIFRDVERK